MNNIIQFQNQSIRQVLLHSRLQIFEVKQLADMEAQFRVDCAKSIAAYRSWQGCYAQETDVVELLYRQLKGIILRRHAENSIRVYWLIRNDFRHIFQQYIANNQAFVTESSDKKCA